MNIIEQASISQMEDKGKSVVEDGESQGSSNSNVISGGFRSSHDMNCPNLQFNHQVPDNDTPNDLNYNNYQNQNQETESEATIVPFDRNGIILDMGNGQTMRMEASLRLVQQLVLPNKPCSFGAPSQGASSSRTQNREIDTDVATSNKGKDIESANEVLDLRLRLNSQWTDADQQGARANHNRPVILSSGYSNYILEDNESGEGSSAGFKKVTCKRKLNGDGSRWLGLDVSTSAAGQAALEQQRVVARTTNYQASVPIQFPSGSPQRERNVRRRIESNQDLLNRVATNPYMQSSLFRQFNHIPGSSSFGMRNNNPAPPMQPLQESGFVPRYAPGIPSSSSVFPAGYFHRGYFPGNVASSSRAAGPSHWNYFPGNCFPTTSYQPGPSGVYPWSHPSWCYQRNYGGEYSNMVVADIMNRRPQREQDNISLILGTSSNIFPISREMGGSIRGGNVGTSQVPMPRRISGYGFTIRDTRQEVGGRGGGRGSNLQVASNPSAAGQSPSSLVSEEQMDSVQVIEDARFGLSEEIIQERMRKETYASNETDRCVICLVDFVEGDDLGKLEYCEHFFHFECITRWLRLKNMCPVCESWALDNN